MLFTNCQVSVYLPLLLLLESVYRPQDLALHFIHTVNVLTAEKTWGRKYLLFVFYNHLME